MFHAILGMEVETPQSFLRDLGIKKLMIFELSIVITPELSFVMSVENGKFLI